ncbi:MAG TPA: CHAD domain-containing protein [Kofleriaceae bacterium]|jgi:CHAD domain-containing protein
MATTTTDASTAHLPQFAEHDKLGPLGAKTSVIDNDGELRRALVAEFSAAADHAREAAGTSDLSAAVHDYRKALRRARAVLSLVSNALPKSERRAVRKALQEARRAVSHARDHSVAPDTLATLPLGEVEREAANAILKIASEAKPQPAEIKQLLAEGAARTAAQLEALQAALPPELAWKSVVKGIKSVYAEARSARRAAKHSKRAFHAWRRRSKELSYQLDVLAGFAGAHVHELHAELDGVADTQSPAVDLVMVRDFVRQYGQTIAPEALDQLVAAIEAQLDDLMHDSRIAGKAAFTKKPQQFGRRLSKLVRRDLSPVDHEPASA